MNPLPPNTEALDVDIAAYAMVDVPVAVTDANGWLQFANAEFACLLGIGPEAARGLPIDRLLGASSSDSAPWLQQMRAGVPFRGLPLSAFRGDGSRLEGSISMGVAGSARVFTLHAAGGPVLLDSQRFALAKSLGHLGFWERDLRTGHGRWDAELWAIWGLPPGDASPAFDRVVQAVVPEDRAAMQNAHEQSFRRCGRYSHRYRIRGTDGQVRQVHSQWEVRPGADGRPARALGIVRDDTETLRLAQSADEAHAQLRMAVELAGISAWRHDLASHRVSFNDRSWAVLGLEPRPEGMDADEVRALIHTDDLAEVRRLSKQALMQDGAVDIGARYRRSDGSWRFVLMLVVAERGQDRQPVALVGVSLDMTDRFEQIQRESELARRLEMATSAAGVATWSADAADGQMRWDDQMRRLHGGAAAPTLEGYRSNYLHPEDRAQFDTGVRALLERSTTMLDLDFRIVSSDGSVRRMASRTALDTSGERPMVQGVMFDVTERHAAEVRLREAHQRIALATRGAGIGTWESTPDGDTVWWDEQMFKLRGIEPRPPPMRRLEALSMIHPEDRESLDRAIQRTYGSGETRSYEFRVVLPDRSVRWLASRSVTLSDELGRPVLRIGINWDITELRAAAAVREEKLLAQRESQAKSQFLARMSHELRTPLNAVLGFAQLLLADGQPADAQATQQRVRHIHSAGKHLLGLINDVLDLSSLESGQLALRMRALPLAPLVAEVMPLMDSLAGARGVGLQCGALDLCVHADPLRLRQVLINLLSNGIKYNRGGGRVGIDAERHGEQVVIRVRDNGRGMTEQQLRHLFEPFNRLGIEREGIEGTGIGLAISRAAVLHMGGTISVSSEPGVGTCFELRLEAAEMSPAAADPAAPALEAMATARHSGRADVLYIEDNAVNVLIVGELVGRRADLRFHSADDGRSGIAMARTLLPALVLVDMQLPDIDGLEVLRQLRADPLTAGLRCVALSANAMPGDIRQAIDAGFSSYLTKPLDFGTFMAELDAQFGRATAP